MLTLTLLPSFGTFSILFFYIRNLKYVFLKKKKKKNVVFEPGDTRGKKQTNFQFQVSEKGDKRRICSRSLCREETEDLDYLLWTCPLARSIWWSFFEAFLLAFRGQGVSKTKYSLRARGEVSHPKESYFIKKPSNSKDRRKGTKEEFAQGVFAGKPLRTSIIFFGRASLINLYGAVSSRRFC